MKYHVITSGYLCALCLFGCTGQIGDGQAGKGQSGQGQFGNGSSASASQPEPAPTEIGGSADTMGVSGLRLLSAAEYRNTVAAVAGDFARDLVEREADTQLNGLTSIANATLAVTERDVELYESNAYAIAGHVVEDVAGRSAFVGCDPSASTCTRDFIARFGLRAWRRPLATKEVDLYASIAEAAKTGLGDAWEGVRYALAGLLTSPHFVYRVELGQVDPGDSSRFKLNDYELASRLSYFLLATTPDAELLAAADKAAVAAKLGEQATRLLALPQARAASQVLFGEYLQLGRMDSVSKLSDIFPQFSASLKASMVAETLNFLMWATFDQSQDFRTLFTGRTTAINAELATLYGVPAPANGAFDLVTFPETSPRIGLLGHASLLSIYSHAAATSPTERGKFVREVLLCQAVPAPPPNVNTALAENTGTTIREKIAQHAKDPACAGCHTLMDPIGLALENFDAIGRYRTSDNGAAIDASGELDGTVYQDARGLAQAIADHPSLPTCFVRTLYRQATGVLENSAQESLIESLTSSFGAASFHVRDALESVVENQAFRYAGPPAEVLQ